MRQIKYILPFLVLFSFFTSCKKGNEGTPAKVIDTNLFIHQISFAAPAQYTGITVTNNTVSLLYNENVNIFLPKQGYELSYAVHLKEDFTHTALATFTFTTIDAEGDVTTNWVDDNLNNITTKTIKDTTVNSIAMAEITIRRPFTFTKTYSDHQSALNEQNYLSNLVTDKIDFSSYVYFTKTYPATATSTPLVYQKSN